VPKLRELEELYQLEAFKPLAQFLLNSYQDLNQQLFSLDFTKADALIKASNLTAQLNLLGSIRSLPLMIKEIKKGLEELELVNQKQKDAVFDPLNLEGVG
jgi:hypothetical protein